jgi:hypothetical protein
MGNAAVTPREVLVSTVPVIAVVSPDSGTLGRYAPLVAKGLIRLSPTTTADLDRLPQYDVPDDVSPLDVLLTERVEDDR